MTRYDVCIVGAGILGVASARHLTRRFPGMRIALVDMEEDYAQHQSGHNSGVVHSGVYYTPGSLRARLCVAGHKSMTEYCTSRGLPLRRNGKYIVAVDPSEVDELLRLYDRALLNGVPGVALVDGTQLAASEPHVAGVAAIHCPGTCITDYGLVTASLAREAEFTFFPRFEVVALQGSVRARDGRTLLADKVLTCAGVYADRVAALSGAALPLQVVPVRGSYLRAAPGPPLVSASIYPVPDARYPFLGVHLTPSLSQGLLLGPSAMPWGSRHPLGPPNAKDTAETLTYPGFHRLLANNMGFGLRQLYHELRPGALVRSLQRYVPALQPQGVTFAKAGVRALPVQRDGHILPDFEFVESQDTVHVLSAASPGATAALELARVLGAKLFPP